MRVCEEVGLEKPRTIFLQHHTEIDLPPRPPRFLLNLANLHAPGSITHFALTSRGLVGIDAVYSPGKGRMEKMRNPLIYSDCRGIHGQKENRGGEI